MFVFTNASRTRLVRAAVAQPQVTEETQIEAVKLGTFNRNDTAARDLK